MRRLKKDDPSSAIFEAYVAEFKDKWANAKALSMDEALAELPEIERKYNLECVEYNNIAFGLNDELSAASKVEIEKLAKLSEAGGLQGLIDQGTLVAVEDGKSVSKAADVAKSIEVFENERDKAVDTVMATKTALDSRR